MIVFDTTTLSLVFIPGATVTDRSTNKPILHAKERVGPLDRNTVAGETADNNFQRLY